jgi:hypothetical protein
MIRKLTLGLVAAATVGAAVLAPTAASAFSVKVGVGPAWHPHHHHVYVAPPLIVGAPLLTAPPTCMEKRLVQTRKGLRWRMVNACAF